MERQKHYGQWQRLYECTLCDDSLKGVYALDGTFEICIKCAEDVGILNRQVRVSRMVEQIRHQIAVEKTGKSVQGLHLTGIVQRLVPDGEIVDIRLKEGLKDYYDMLCAFEEAQVRVFLKPSSTALKWSLGRLIMHCTTDEEFATWQTQTLPKEAVFRPWLTYVKTVLKNTQSSAVNYHRVRWLIGHALKPKRKEMIKQFGLAREALDIRLKEGLKDYYDVVSIFQDEELTRGGFPTGEYQDNAGLQTSLRTVIASFWRPLIRSKTEVESQKICWGCAEPFPRAEFADETKASGRGNLCLKCKKILNRKKAVASKARHNR